jgi:5-methylthioribose kinase
MRVWNPAFDVTPAQYIAGIMTERGVIAPNDKGILDVAAFVAQSNSAQESTDKDAPSALYRPPGYKEQSTDSLPELLAQEAPKAMEMLGSQSASDLECVEVGDGNLNLVFIVTNKRDKSKQVIVKQALPYVRCVGESWPLTLERSYFEYKALTAEKEACPDFVPSVYYFSKLHGLMVMQYLAPPCIILRKGLIQGIQYPTMAQDMGSFCAQTLFRTSGFALSTTALREQVQFWSRNTEMCALTEQVVFTEPYITANYNRWTSPQLDEDKKAIEQDDELKVAAQYYKHKFVTQTEALIHADLHSGSVMCAPEAHQTFVIDPEFAFYGPMGFDTGAFIANLFLNYFSQAGHTNATEYPEWVLDQVKHFWNRFCAEFEQLWGDESVHTGFRYGRDVLQSVSAQSIFFQQVLADTLGFAGMKMLRRIVGIAHVEDLESIADPNALNMAKNLIKNASKFATIEDVIALAREVNSSASTV